MSKSSKRKWWELSSAADDGNVDLGDDFGSAADGGDDDGDWIDRFKFSDYRADRGLSSTEAIWDRYGYTGSSFGDYGKGWSKSPIGKTLGVDFATAKKIEAAQKLVQGFVDTFAIDNPLSARFSARTKEVGGEADAKSVVVSHRPLLDPTLTQPEAHRVMTAQAANAAARARYGGQASDDRQVQVTNLSLTRADREIVRDLGRILDGYRIDSTFRRDYPGYEDVYAPAQEYIAKGLLRGRAAFDLEDFAGASIANAALNFGDFTDWTGREEERDYWKAWADQYAHAPINDFARGVVEAADHLAITLPPKPKPPTPPQPPKGGGDPGGEGGEDGGQPGGSGGKGTGQGKGAGKADQDEQPEQDDDKGETNEQAPDAEQDDTDSPTGAGSDSGDPDEQADRDERDGDPDNSDWDDDPEPLDEPQGGSGASPGSVVLPTSLGTGVSLTGQANGQSKDIDPDEAERLAETATALAIGKDEGEIGEVYWSANGFKGEYGSNRLDVKPESAANGYIRRAFTRSKTAHYALERGHVNGRIDNRSLPRIASDDYRLFAKRVAPSETKYRVWLLIDNSGSMGGVPVRDAANLAASVALAVRHIPNVTLDVWAWTTGIRINNAVFSAVRIYADGDPIQKIGDVGLLPQGGTPDGAVLSWASREILKQCRKDEVPVILMASDGTGSLNAESYYNQPGIADEWRANGLSEERIAQYLKRAGESRVGKARKAGIKVLSVAIGNLDQDSQDRTYGKGNHLLWQGSIKAMAKPLGDLIARVASNRIK